MQSREAGILNTVAIEEAIRIYKLLITATGDCQHLAVHRRREEQLQRKRIYCPEFLTNYVCVPVKA